MTDRPSVPRLPPPSEGIGEMCARVRPLEEKKKDGVVTCQMLFKLLRSFFRSRRGRNVLQYLSRCHIKCTSLPYAAHLPLPLPLAPPPSASVMDFAQRITTFILNELRMALRSNLRKRRRGAARRGGGETA